MRTKEQYIVEQLINEMFKIAGHDITYDDIKERTDDWFLEYSMTLEQQTEWIGWGVNYLRKQLRCPKYLAEKQMDMFNLQYGLTISDYDSERTS